MFFAKRAKRENVLLKVKYIFGPKERRANLHRQSLFKDILLLVTDTFKTHVGANLTQFGELVFKLLTV